MAFGASGIAGCVTVDGRVLALCTYRDVTTEGLASAAPAAALGDQVADIGAVAALGAGLAAGEVGRYRGQGQGDCI